MGLLVVGLFFYGPSLVPADHVVVRGKVASLSFSADGRFLAVGRTRGLIEIWEAESGDLDDRLASDLPAVHQLVFGSDPETLVLGTERGAVL